MTARRRDSVKDRRECFDKWKRVDAAGRVWLDCHICNLPIDVTKGEKWDALESWEAEHVIPDFFGGTDIRPAHPQPCHSEKSKKDAGDIAKAKRVRDKHFGIRRPQGFRKPPEGYIYSWSQRRYIRESEAS